MTRVIAGAARGRRLTVPSGDDVRPTSDRVKEALFSSLAPLLPGARVIDLFAGSGGLGLEALSRGAATVTFVERRQLSLEALQRNVAVVGLPGAEVVAADVAVALTRTLPGEPFDLAVLDPPYREPDAAVEAVLAALVGHLAAGATVVVERAARDGAPPWPPEVLAGASRRYGDTALHRAVLGAAGASRPPTGEERQVTVATVCPGSFDPVTLGHLDIIERAARRFDHVVVAVVGNPGKRALFDVDERVELIEAEVGHLDNVEVDRFEGLLVDFCNARGIGIVCKGLRAVSDFEFELKMAQMNQRIGDVETVFMSTSPEHSYLSSSLVKEVARLGGRLDGTVPDRVASALRARLA